MPIAIKHISATVTTSTTLYTCPPGRTAKLNIASLSYAAPSGASAINVGGRQAYLLSGTSVSTSQTLNGGAISLNTTRQSLWPEYIGPGETLAFSAFAGSSLTISVSIVEEIAS